MKVVILKNEGQTNQVHDIEDMSGGTSGPGSFILEGKY